MYAYMYVYMYLYIHILTYIYMHVYIYIYHISIYIYKSIPPFMVLMLQLYRCTCIYVLTYCLLFGPGPGWRCARIVLGHRRRRRVEGVWGIYLGKGSHRNTRQSPNKSRICLHITHTYIYIYLLIYIYVLIYMYCACA